MTIVTLYFGENIPGRPPLTEAEWTEFLARIVTPAFPDGFTVTTGQGQWRDPGPGLIARERSKIVTVALPHSRGIAARIEAVRAAYEKAFAQTTVGVTTAEGCGAF